MSYRVGMSKKHNTPKNVSRLNNTDMSKNRNFYDRDREHEQEQNKRLELNALARRCTVYTDTRCLMCGTKMAGFRALVKSLNTFGKCLSIPVCFYSELQQTIERDNGRNFAAVAAMKRVEQMKRKGEVEICHPDSAGMYADVGMLRILSDLNAWETAVLITDDRVLAAKAAALDIRADTRRRGHILVRRMGTDGYLQQIPGIRNSSAASLGLTPWVKAPMPAICPHAYKSGDWDGELDED